MELKLIYGIVAVISLLLIIGYCKLIRKKEMWFALLYCSVFVTNAGYFFLAMSDTVDGALMANRAAYLGSVFLPLCMLMIILNVCKIESSKRITGILFFISVIVFLIAASGGYVEWYYEDASLVFINGAAKLIKTYGPLHSLYFVYLFVYFAAMAAMILFAFFRKKVFDWKHAALLLCVTFGNILIWFIEQLINVDFEFLSVSYIITELFLLLLYGLLQDHGVLNDITVIKERLAVLQEDLYDVEKLTEHYPELKVLTARELEVLKPILQGKKRKDIADELSVTEHTIKKHTAHIFAKLEVTSRDELYEKLGIK